MIKSENSYVLKWWVGASFDLYEIKVIHIGVMMSLGRVSAYYLSTRKNINTKSSLRQR